jgi:hypothetical protein
MKFVMMLLRRFKVSWGCEKKRGGGGGGGEGGARQRRLSPLFSRTVAVKARVMEPGAESKVGSKVLVMIVVVEQARN